MIPSPPLVCRKQHVHFAAFISGCSISISVTLKCQRSPPKLFAPHAYDLIHRKLGHGDASAQTFVFLIVVCVMHLVETNKEKKTKKPKIRWMCYLSFALIVYFPRITCMFFCDLILCLVLIWIDVCTVYTVRPCVLRICYALHLSRATFFFSFMLKIYLHVTRESRAV